MNAVARDLDLGPLHGAEPEPLLRVDEDDLDRGVILGGSVCDPASLGPDRVTAPAYHEHSEEELTQALYEAGFTTVQRLTRYPKMTNIRRFLSPLYERYDSKFARLFYGSGAVQLKAIKSI